MKSNLINSLKPSTIAAALLFCFHATARADVADKITKSFQVQPGGQLVVELDRGSIEVKTSDAESVDIEITRKAEGSRSRAERTLHDHVVTATQTDNMIKVQAEYKGATSRSWFSRSPKLQVNCRITVPRKFNVDLKTAGGHIRVAELTGKVQAHTSGGSLGFEKITGQVSGHTSGGSITIAGVKGKVEAKSSGGSLRLVDIEGDMTAQTSGGSIHAKKLIGRSVLKTSGGSIEIVGITGQIDARTSGGSITARLPVQPAGDCTFKTSGGNVTVVLDEKVAVDVDARTSGGRVSTEFPVETVIQGEQRKNELRGKINGGGPLITAQTSGGSVHLEKD
jgi:ribosomal protein L6P/L9E